MKKLIDNEVDVGIGGTSLTYIRSVFLTETKPYTTTPLAIIVSPGEEFGDFEKFARPFSNKVWLASWAVFAACLIIMIIAINSSKDVYNFVIGANVKDPLLNTIAVNLGVSQGKLPKGNFARYTLMILIIYCLVLRSVYLGGIFNALQSNDKKPDVKSIDEMIDKKFIFFVYETLAPRVKDFKFFERSVVYPNTEIEIYRRKTLNPTSKSAVFNYLDQILFTNLLNHKNFTYRICKERFSTNQFVFYFRKNHFLVDDVDEKLELMLMNGNIGYIISQYANTRFLKQKIENKHPTKLTVHHLNGAFRILWMCNALSVAVFVIEVLMKVRQLRCLHSKE